MDHVRILFKGTVRILFKGTVRILFKGTVRLSICNVKNSC